MFIVKRLFCNMQIICWPNSNQLWPTRWQCQRPRTEPGRNWNRKESSREQCDSRPTCTCKEVPSHPMSQTNPVPHPVCVTHSWQLWPWSSSWPRSCSGCHGVVASAPAPAVAQTLTPVMRGHCAHLTFGLLISLACGHGPANATIFHKWIIFVPQKYEAEAKKAKSPGPTTNVSHGGSLHINIPSLCGVLLF